MSKNNLTRLVQNYFERHLAIERGLRTHTIVSYRDTMKLYLKYLTKRSRLPIQKLSLKMLTAKSVLGFIDDCSTTRMNGAKTTNQRLAVLKSFFSYLMNYDPERIAEYERVFHLKSRRVPYRPVEYLERSEIKAILNAVDRSTMKGVRDYAALMFLYNTGARAQELCDVRVDDLRLEKPSLAVLHGKGQKTRQVPLWPETVGAIKKLMEEHSIIDKQSAVLFTNQNGERLTRFGLR